MNKPSYSSADIEIIAKFTGWETKTIESGTLMVCAPHFEYEDNQWQRAERILMDWNLIHLVLEQVMKDPELWKKFMSKFAKTEGIYNYEEICFDYMKASKEELMFTLTQLLSPTQDIL